MKPFKLVFALLLACNILSFAAPDDKDRSRRARIDEFISNYKAAYQKEEIEYIRDFFSNDALIITETGKLLHAVSEMVPNSTKSRPYKTVIEDKKKYIERLNHYFLTSGGITLGISDPIITRHPKYTEIYGINFFQVWEDIGGEKNLEKDMPGYIFLMIDFKESETEPIIHVRTWQPKQNISKPADKYTLTDFRIISSK